MMNDWTRRRLEILFRRYNVRYWNGRLPAYAVEGRKLMGCVGLCSEKWRHIWIDVEAHKTDGNIRETLLHEMCHVADKSKSRIAHGYGFLREFEMLLRKRAPVRFGCPEAPQFSFIELAIPRGFPLCRKVAMRIARKREREVDKLGRNIPVEEITEDSILRSFEDAAAEGLTWKKALWAVGSRNGLLDVEGNPVNTWASRIVRKGESAHGRVRAMILKSKRLVEAKRLASHKITAGGPPT